MTPDEKTRADEGDAGEDAARPTQEEIASVPVDKEPLERSEEAIDEAREAVSKVAQTDSIDEEVTGAGELPAFADSALGGPSDDGATEGDEADEADGGDATGD